MKTLITDAAAIPGKTIERIELDCFGGLVLLFTDNTFAIFKAEQDYEDSIRLDMAQEYHIGTSSSYDTVRWEIATQSECDAARAAWQAEMDAMRNQREIEEFSRLKKKFSQ